LEHLSQGVWLVPKIRSSKKRMRQSRKARDRNRQQRTALRNTVKKARAVRGTPEADAARLDAEQLLDRAARKRLIHPNTAARHKSRLVKSRAI
jgi:small subunit ribosomal protein S20